MASVHESLYFNPMMTNGVVHANVFGTKDWVTPYKISVLALLHDMTVNRTSLAERRPLNQLILPLQQVGPARPGPVLLCPALPGLALTHRVPAEFGPDPGPVPQDCGPVLPQDRLLRQAQVVDGTAAWFQTASSRSHHFCASMCL